MKMTKFEHACLMLDNGINRLLIDPGLFTQLPEDIGGISAIVITEEHTDHYNLENVQKILAQNPELKILSTKSVAGQLSEAGISCEAVAGEHQLEIGGFMLRLKEGDHAPIYKLSPCRVLTVQVNDFLYYPSDSFIPTSATVEVLALPTSGPWYKVSEAVDFANAVDSKKILVTHNNLYNEIGNTVTNNFTSSNIADKQREYIFLKDGESKEF